MQRNLLEAPAIIFADDLFGPSSKGKSYYAVSIHPVNGLVITYHAASSGEPNKQHTILPGNISDKEGILAAVRKKNYRNTAQILPMEKMALRKLIQNFHQTLVSTTACADVAVNIFREFYNLDEKSARIIKDTALTCIDVVCQTSGEPIEGKIRGEVAEYFFVYLRRYLAATVKSKTFTDILNFKLYENTYPGTIEYVANDTMLLGLARSFRDIFPPNESPFDNETIKEGLICVLEKIFMATFIATYKILPEDAYWNVDFTSHFPSTMQIKQSYKYNTLPRSTNNAIVAVLNILENYFYKTLDYKLHVKPSELRHDSFNISRSEISLAGSPSQLFHHAQVPAAAEPEPKKPSILRQSS